MEKHIGFIGCGKMAQAIIQGLLQSNIVDQKEVIVSAASTTTLHKVKEQYNIKTTLDNKEVASKSTFLVLAVKPDLHSDIIKEIRENVDENTVIITIAAGISLEFLEEAFGHNVKAVRTMPNTPSLVGEGMTALCANENVKEAELQEVVTLFESFGKVEVIEEKLMDAIPAISGSSPAYVYMFIEALADGGVLQGIPRDKSYRLAAQAVLGAAKMVLETGKHPGELKDQVCTPGGATIEAVASLEKTNLRASVLSAMEKCADKTRALSEKK